MPALEKNRIYRAHIDGYSSEGLGIARIDGQVVFVHGAVRGETCDVLVMKVLKNAAFGKIAALVEPSPARRQPDCPYYGRCGGCDFRHMSYEEELADTIIMLTAYSEREFVEQAKDYGVSGYLVKPIDEKSLIPNIELVVAQSKEMKRLRKDMAKVSERLANRSIIEKAKGQVMQEHNLSEQEAYHYIRKLSQLKGLSMRRVAEMILVKGGG